MPKRSLAIAGGVAATLIVASAGGLVLFGCSEEGASTSITQAAGTSTSTTAVSTTSPATTSSTTTLPPGVPITLTLEGDGRLQTAARDFYGWLGAPFQVEPPPMAEGLAAFLADVEPEEGFGLNGTFTTADLDDGGRVAVVAADEDVLLAVDDGEGWRIVGAKLPSMGLGAWYGEPIRYVLIIGTDARPGYIERVFRGDSLHLLSSNIGEAAGGVLGIPRDAYVDTPYGWRDKLSSVNARADSEAVVDIVRDLSGLPVEGYLVTGFASFTNLVDNYGGVVVDVPFSMADPKSQAFLSAGEQTLWGANALAFSRNRSIWGSDFTRSYHQGLVILGALDKAQATDILELPRLLRLLCEYTWTDLTAEELLTLAAGAFEIDPANTGNAVLPGTIQMIAGASVVILDPEAEEFYRDLDDGILTPSE
ncbi:MAG TPA: LCP family protein [Acidimicrobiia bacterium]|nr:LCP family protein [Acidimicrobiia bacterium]